MRLVLDTDNRLGQVFLHAFEIEKVWSGSLVSPQSCFMKTTFVCNMWPSYWILRKPAGQGHTMISSNAAVGSAPSDAIQGYMHLLLHYGSGSIQN
jgi:hypothetical protein